MTRWRPAKVNAAAAITRDGHVLEIRPVAPDDACLRKLSKDYAALVALDHERIIAVAFYEHGDRERKHGVAEVFVDPRHHGRGIATLLLEHLDAVAPTSEPRTEDGNQVAHLLTTYGIPTAVRHTEPRIVVRPLAETVTLAAAIERDTTGQAVLRLEPAAANATLTNDRTYRPATDPDIATMWRSLRTAPLLRSHAIDTGALEDLTQRLAKLARDHPEVTELTLNPILAGTERLVVIDAKLRLATTNAAT